MNASTLRRAAALLIAAAISARSGAALAEDPKARAQQLFQEGVAAVEAGKAAEGCGKLRESLALFAVANTLFNVAQCDEREAKIGTALGHWERGLALLDPKDPRVKVAKERIAALDPKVPRVNVVVPDQSAFTVLLDGEPLTAGALAAPLRLDPDRHVFVFKVAGREDRSREITLAPGERTEVVAAAGPPVAAPPPPVVTPPVVAPPPIAAPPPPPASAPSTGLRTAGFVTLGVGGAALIAAGITGGMVLSRRAAANEACPSIGGTPTCGPTFADQLSKDKSLVIGNTVAWGVGLAGVATGVTLLVISARKPAASTALVPVPFTVTGGAGIGVRGAF